MKRAKTSFKHKKDCSLTSSLLLIYICEKEWLIRYVCYLILLKNGQTYPVVSKIESNHTCKIHSCIHFYTCFRSVFIHSFSPPFIIVICIITLFRLFGKGKIYLHFPCSNTSYGKMKLDARTIKKTGKIGHYHIPHIFTFFTNIFTIGTRNIDTTNTRNNWKAVTIVTFACTEAAIIPI